MDFYFASILLEKNRWTEGKTPSYSPAVWVDRIRAGGFCGLELWENHAYAASPKELQILKSAFPGILFNTYADFSRESINQLEKAARMIQETGAVGCKFNFGNEPEKETEYLHNFCEWSRSFPSDFRFLCECHANTLMEMPQEAARLLDYINDSRVEVIIHARIEPLEAAKWFDALGQRITHCHLNLFGLDGDPRRHPMVAGFDLGETFRRIGRSNVRTVSLEFTGGVGEDSEDMEELFSSALSDRDYFQSVLDSIEL